MELGSRHPDDSRLVASYFGDAEPSVERHVGRCQPCAARRDALQAALERDRARLVRSAADCFTPARLEAQRVEVLARLERPRRARVLAFPGAASHRRPAASAPWRVRWIAAAAAVMVAVAGAGWMVEEGRGLRHQSGRVAVAGSVTSGEPDEAALAAIDMALARPGADELLAIDALTLRAVPVSASDRR